MTACKTALLLPNTSTSRAETPRALFDYLFAILKLPLLALVTVGLALVSRAQESKPDPNPNNDEPSDEELMTRYVAGDQRAFQILMRRYQRKVFGYIYKFYYNEDKASDIFQDAFFKVCRGADKYDPRYRFSTWLFTVVRNTVIDDFKKRKLKVRYLSDPLYSSGKDDDRTLYDATPDRTAPEGEKLAREKQFQRKLQDALAKMNPDQREVFMMRQDQGLQFEEIAEIMACPLNTAKTRMRYALEALRRDLKEFF